jgi:DNA polymerase III delta prime subunit
MENGSFAWKDSNCGIYAICRYTDNKKCESYHVKWVMEQNYTTMLFAAEPGMGKSTFLSCMKHEIKRAKLRCGQ